MKDAETSESEDGSLSEPPQPLVMEGEVASESRPISALTTETVLINGQLVRGGAGGPRAETPSPVAATLQAHSPQQYATAEHRQQSNFTPTQGQATQVERD